MCGTCGSERTCNEEILILQAVAVVDGTLLLQIITDVDGLAKSVSPPVAAQPYQCRRKIAYNFASAITED